MTLTLALPLTAVIDVATSTIVGRITAGTGPAEGLTAAQVRTLINVESGATSDQSDAEIETAYGNQVIVVSQAEAEAGTATTARRWTAQRISQAIVALGSSVSEGGAYAGGTATGIIYVDASGDMRSDGPSVDASGRVGINDTTPDAMLDAVCAAATDVGVRVEAAAAQSADMQQWAINGGEVHARITDYGEFSNTGPGGIAANTQNELFGINAGDNLSSGHSSVAMGYAAWGGASTGHTTVAIGGNALSTSNGNKLVAVGYNAGLQTGNSTQAVMVGYESGKNSNYTVSNCVYLGYQADTGSSPATVSGAICIGSGAECVDDNTFVAGSGLFPIDTVYFGKGVTNATPTAYTINGTGGSGTDIAGADIKIASGKSTGSGAGGSVELQTAAAGSTGTAANALSTRMKIDGEGAITFPGIPTSDPGVTGVLWSDSGTLKLSP